MTLKQILLARCQQYIRL